MEDCGVARTVCDVLPHRPPFLFISRIVSVEAGVCAVCEFDVPYDMPLFQGHFPEEPILPGVIILEMMAQSGAVALLSQEDMKGRLAYLAGIESARFRKPVRPGDVIRADVNLGSVRRRIGRGDGIAYVKDQEVARARIVFAVGDAPGGIDSLSLRC